MLIRVLIEILIDIKTSGLDLVTVSLICLRSAVWGNFSLKKWTDIAFLLFNCKPQHFYW